MPRAVASTTSRDSTASSVFSISNNPSIISPPVDWSTALSVTLTLLGVRLCAVLLTILFGESKEPPAPLCAGFECSLTDDDDVLVLALTCDGLLSVLVSKSESDSIVVVAVAVVAAVAAAFWAVLLVVVLAELLLLLAAQDWVCDSVSVARTKSAVQCSAGSLSTLRTTGLHHGDTHTNTCSSTHD